MKRVELKRIAEILWKGNSADEKTPFAGQGTLPDNGSFSKNFDSEDVKKSTKEFLESGEEEKVDGPMSIPRKLCFAMSFNVWIIYFLALGWLIPCRKMECGQPYPDRVETNLSSIWILTPLETMNAKGLPSFAMIGYEDGTLRQLSSLATSDATFVWNNSLSFTPRKIQCNFEVTFDANRDGVPDCLLSGVYDVYAFNATNGYVFWHQRISSEEGNIVSDFHPTIIRNGEGFLIGAYGDKIVVLDAQNGTKVSEISHPCKPFFEIRIVSNTVSNNLTLWSLVCDYGDQMEAWSFGEQDVLSEGKLEKNANVSDFALLFSGTNSGGSIDLGCDVTPIPGGPLLLSWADRVAMVTQEAIAWERHFPEPLTVASIEVGHFSNAKELHVAAAVHNGTNTIVYILETRNGSIVDSVMLEDRQAEAMEKITSNLDLLVLKSRSFNYTSQPLYNYSDPIPTDQTNFLLIDFSHGSFKVKDIASTSVVQGWALNMQTNGETDLLVLKSENGFTSYLKYILHHTDSQNNVICIGSKHRHHYSFET